jgi:hypothetical protein
MLQDGVSSCEPRSGIEIEAKTLLKEMLQRERGDADKPATKFWPREAICEWHSAKENTRSASFGSQAWTSSRRQG